jgi:hypothetical protein
MGQPKLRIVKKPRRGGAKEREEHPYYRGIAST